MRKTEFVAFDLETTGLSPWFHRIVELAAVRFRADGTELARMSQLVDPGCRIPAEATQVHGITAEMVRGQPVLQDVLPVFVEFLGSSATILLAHNAGFDVGFLSAAFTAAGGPIPAHCIYDTLDLARCRLPSLTRHNLAAVCRHLKIRNAKAHRALSDALAVKDCFVRMLAIAPQMKGAAQLRAALSPRCFESLAATPSRLPPGCRPLRQAIAVQQTLSILYENSPHPRLITPRRLFELRSRIYLVALCHRDNIEKHFRLDRILRIE